LSLSGCRVERAGAKARSCHEAAGGRWERHILLAGGSGFPAFGFRLSAFGFRLSAFGFRLSAFGGRGAAKSRPAYAPCAGRRCTIATGGPAAGAAPLVHRSRHVCPAPRAADACALGTWLA
jgi:hypothetical protein